MSPKTKAKPKTQTQIRPLADRILLKRLEGDELSTGGIVIPDTAKEKPQQAEVVAVGPGRLSDTGTRIPPGVKKRDRVLIGKYSGTDVTINDTEFVILREDDVLGIIA